MPVVIPARTVSDAEHDRHTPPRLPYRVADDGVRVVIPQDLADRLASLARSRVPAPPVAQWLAEADAAEKGLAEHERTLHRLRHERHDAANADPVDRDRVAEADRRLATAEGLAERLRVSAARLRQQAAEAKAKDGTDLQRVGAEVCRELVAMGRQDAAGHGALLGSGASDLRHSVSHHGSRLRSVVDDGGRVLAAF